MKDTYFVTTAIDYTNAAPHIGHAYEKTLADVLARYERLRGREVYFLTGVDQHGQKVQQSAEREGVAPREFAERNTALFRDFYQKLEVSYDGWAATTDPRHVRAVQRVLQDLFARGQIYKARYEGYYSVRQEQFLTDKERNAAGEFGPEWGEVVYLEEENYYFRLSEHRDWLVGFLEQHGEFIKPRFRAADALNAARKVSADLCISRPKERLTWGIELPFDDRYVTYVWFDALLNYASFAGLHADDGKDVGGLPELGKLWPPDAQVIGKDILVPAHGIYWPAMLHAMGFADDQMPCLLVHGWWNVGGAKMSKSLGNAVNPDALADRYGAETLRYYLMREIVTGQDADFSEERLRSIHESELANGVGNLLNRTLNMANRYRAGRLAAIATADDPGLPELGELRRVHAATVAAYGAALDDAQPRAGLEALRELTTAANRLIDVAAPFKLAKLTGDEAAQRRVDLVLAACAETCRTLALLLAPVLPAASAKMLIQLNGPPPNAGEDGLALAATWGALGEGHTVNAPSPVFPRLEPAAG